VVAAIGRGRAVRWMGRCVDPGLAVCPPAEAGDCGQT
jgi:hypothetical protein